MAAKSGAAGAGAHRQLAGDLRLASGREGGGLLVADMDPVDRAGLAQRLGQPVQAVADHTEYSLHAGLMKRGNDQIGNAVRHGISPLWLATAADGDGVVRHGVEAECAAEFQAINSMAGYPGTRRIAGTGEAACATTPKYDPLTPMTDTVRARLHLA